MTGSAPKLTRVGGVALAMPDFDNPALLRSKVANMKPANVRSLVADRLKLSARHAELLAHALIAPASAKPTPAEYDRCEASGAELVAWAAAARTEERAVVIGAFGRASQIRELMFQVGQLQRGQARAFVKDVLDAEGGVAAAADWLGEAGFLIASARGQGPVFDGLSWGGFARGATKIVKGAVDAVSSAVSTVVDGIETAGKSIQDVLGAAASWTANRVQGLVMALIEAGKKAVDVLTAAAKYGAEMVRGAVAGILAAGKPLKDVVVWAVSQGEQLALSALDAAMDLGRSVAQVLAEAVSLPAASLRYAVRMVLKSGRRAVEVLAAVVTCAISVQRTVLEGLIAAHVHLAEVVLQVCRGIPEEFRKGFVEGLIAIGYGVVEIFKAALEAGLSIAALAFAALLEALGGHRGLTANEIAEARKIFGWSIDLDRVRVASSSLPADLITAVNGGRPFTTMYVLNFNSKADFKPNGEIKDLAVLIHELTHVWQGVQDGPIYMIEALEAQLRQGLGAYRYSNEELVANGGDLNAFGREAQAAIVEDYYRLRYVDRKLEAEWGRLAPYALDVYRSKSVHIPGIVILRPPVRLPDLRIPSLPIPVPRVVTRGATTRQARLRIGGGAVGG